MDNALDLADYLPVSFKAPSEQEYISFLWETFEENCGGGKYQFAFLAYHMLMMSFIYFNIWQVRQTLPDDFSKSLIGFGRQIESDLLNATSPFSLSTVNERTVLRFLKLIACDNSKIGAYAKLVDDRNDSAHANGNVFFSTQREVDDQIHRVLRAVEEIQTHSHSVIQGCYETFLLESHNPEEREYLLAEDQIREILVHGNYMSRKDIEFCVNFDITGLHQYNWDAIKALHNTLCELYGTTHEDGA